MDNGISIAAAKHEMKEVLTKTEELRKHHTYLKNSIATIPHKEYVELLSKITTIKSSIDDLLNKYEQCDVQKQLKVKLNRRIKKRRKSKLKHEETKKQRRQLNEKIDKILELKRKEFGEILEKKSIIKKTKISLSKIKSKIEASKEQIDRLKLSFLNDETEEFDREEFDLHEDKLKEYICRQNKLKEILEINSETIGDKWRQTLFGSKDRDCKIKNKKELYSFFDNRQIWDSYVMPPSSECGTAIPLGFIVPPENPNQSWTNYLFSENTEI